MKGRVLRDLLFNKVVKLGADFRFTVPAGATVDLLHPSKWTERVFDHVERLIKNELTQGQDPWSRKQLPKPEVLRARAKDRWCVMIHSDAESIDDYALLVPGADVEAFAVVGSAGAEGKRTAPRRRR